jgi:hypothetical protein
MSDDTLSSPPPSLPMPITTICCGRPCSSRGSPWRSASAAWWKVERRGDATSASVLQVAVTSARSASRPGRARWRRSHTLPQLPQALVQRGFVGAGRLAR